MTRKLVRTTLAAAIILFAWYAASAVATGSPGAVPLALAAAALLFLVVFALGRRRA